MTCSFYDISMPSGSSSAHIEPLHIMCTEHRGSISHSAHRPKISESVNALPGHQNSGV